MDHPEPQRPPSPYGAEDGAASGPSVHRPWTPPGAGSFAAGRPSTHQPWSLPTGGDSFATGPTRPYGDDWRTETQPPPDVLPTPPLIASGRLDRAAFHGRQAQVTPVSSMTGTHRDHRAVVTHYRGQVSAHNAGRLRFESQLAALEVPVECPETLLTPRRGVRRLRYWFGARDRSLPRVLTDHFNIDTREATFAREVFDADVSRWLVAHPETATLRLYFEGRWMSCVLPSAPDPTVARRQLDFLADVHERLWPQH